MFRSLFLEKPVAIYLQHFLGQHTVEQRDIGETLQSLANTARRNNAPAPPPQSAPPASHEAHGCIDRQATQFCATVSRTLLLLLFSTHFQTLCEASFTAVVRVLFIPIDLLYIFGLSRQRIFFKFCILVRTTSACLGITARTPPAYSVSHRATNQTFSIPSSTAAAFCTCRRRAQ